MRNQTYCVGGHLFQLSLPEGNPLWSQMAENYGPFEVDDDGTPLFCLSLSAHLPVVECVRVIYCDLQAVSDFLRFRISQTDRGLLVELQLPTRSEVDARLLVDLSGRCYLSLSGDVLGQFVLLNSAAQLCFLMATAHLNTVLMHASAVISDGFAYLFLGKSGTGKSTHSRMWHLTDPKAVLLNDDHPVVRAFEDGRVMAYGSPWSGKTHCYKNLSAPLGGFVRIRQAARNRICRLSPMESYASLLSSCSGFSWEKSLADGRDVTMQLLVKRVSCWRLDCLPNEEAARLCRAEITGHVLGGELNGE